MREVKAMKKMTNNEQRSIVGGKTFYCPFCRRNGKERKFTTLQALSYKIHLATCPYKSR